MSKKERTVTELVCDNCHKKWESPTARWWKVTTPIREGEKYIRGYDTSEDFCSKKCAETWILSKHYIHEDATKEAKELDEMYRIIGNTD